MKYFTKEWCELLGKTIFRNALKEDIRATVYSEEYFRALYNEALNKHLVLQKKVLSAPFNAVAVSPEVDSNTLASLALQGASKYEVEKFKKRHLRRRDAAQKHWDSQYPYNEQKQTENYKIRFESNLNRVKNDIPEDILNDIADIRVFALRRATKEIIERVNINCENTQNQIDKTISDYYEYFNKASQSFDPNIVENMHFGDCKVIGMQQNEDSLTLFIDNACVFTDIDQITFKGHKIIEQNDSLLNGWWLNHEIYKMDEKYEIHVLLERDHKKIDFIISADQILFHHNTEAP